MLRQCAQVTLRQATGTGRPDSRLWQQARPTGAGAQGSELSGMAMGRWPVTGAESATPAAGSLVAGGPSSDHTGAPYGVPLLPTRLRLDDLELQRSAPCLCPGTTPHSAECYWACMFKMYSAVSCCWQWHTLGLAPSGGWLSTVEWCQGPHDRCLGGQWFEVGWGSDD